MLQLPTPRSRKKRDAAIQESTVPVMPKLSFFSGPSEAGENKHYSSSLRETLEFVRA